MRKATVYTCEFCGKEFDNAYECGLCEESHVESYESSSIEELIETIDDLGRRAYDYRINNSVMGIPVHSFENLMGEVAKRLEKVKEK